MEEPSELEVQAAEAELGSDEEEEQELSYDEAQNFL